MNDLERMNFSQMLLSKSKKDLKQMSNLIMVERYFRLVKKTREHKSELLARSLARIGRLYELSGLEVSGH